jgi:leukotriene-A4 hydrolase
LVGEKNFQIILQTYIKKFRLQSIVYTDFKEHFELEVRRIFNEEEAILLLSKINWEKWIKLPGFPIEKFDFSNNIVKQAENLSQQILNGGLDTNIKSVFQSWSTNAKLIFFQHLGKTEISKNVYEFLRDTLDLHSGQNCEIYTVWYQLALRNGYSDVVPHVKNFLSTIGRMKYLRPVFRAFYAYNKEDAKSTFDQYR